MTEDVKDTTKEDIQDTVEAPPVPTPSATSPDKASEQPQVDAGAVANQVVEMLGPTLDKLVDSRFKATTDSSFEDVRTIAAYLKAANGDEELAVRNMAIDQMVAERTAGKAASEPPAGGGEDALVTKRMTSYARRVLSKAEIDWDNDEGYAALLKEVNENWDGIGEDGFYDKLDSLVDNVQDKAGKQSSVGLGAKVGGGGANVAPTDDEDLLEQIMKAQKHPVQNAAKIKELMAEARKRELLPQQ